MLDKDGKEIEAKTPFEDLFHMRFAGIGELHFPNPDFVKNELPSRDETDHVRDRGWWAK
jgi:hypothetical protein